MTFLAFVAVTIVGWGVLVYVIVHLLADNRRLTAACLAPRPDLAYKVIATDPKPKRERDDDERPLRPIGA